MTGERWEPSPTVRAYQRVEMIIPALIAGASALSKSGLLSGSKYTKGTLVSRFTAAQTSDVATARALADQAFHHGYRENIPDAGVWQGLYASMRAVANPELGAYMDAQALTAGGAVVTKQSGPSATGGSSILDSLGKVFQQVTGPTADAAAEKAGQASASALKGTVLLVGVGLAAVVIVVLLMRRK